MYLYTSTHTHTNARKHTYKSFGTLFCLFYYHCYYYHEHFSSSRQAHITEVVRPSVYAHSLFTRLSYGELRRKVGGEGERRREKKRGL